jgi:signal transduction histidine kinase
MLGVQPAWLARGGLGSPLFQLKVSARQFGQIVIGLVILGFLGLLAAGGAAGLIMTLSQSRTRWVNHTYEVERHINGFRIQIERLEAGRRGYLLDQDPSFRQVYIDAASAIPGEIASLKYLTADNPRQQANLAALTTDVDRLKAQLVISMADAQNGQRAKALQDFTADGSVALARRTRQLTAAMLAEETRLLRQRTGDQNNLFRDFFLVLVFSAVWLALVAVLSVMVIQRYTRELANSRDSLKDLNDNLELAVDARTADLRRANDEIQRFAYIVSHDLRSPLVNVLGFTAELEAASKSISGLIERAQAEAPQIVTEETRRAVNEDVPEAIGFIRTSTQKMDRLINAILKLSREGRRTVTPELLNMDDLLRGVADSLQHRVDDLGAEVVVEGPLPRLVSDRVAIEQIFSNLVENAVKYLKPGRPGRIRVSGALNLGRAIFEVADNGRGIDPKDHERVFDLFRRSGVQDQPGEGIGLAHVRALAYRLGGIISCESTLGEGATFRLSLPVAFMAEEPK